MEYPTFSDSGIQLPIRPEGIAFDMDGTLLDYDSRLSDSVAKAVRLITRGGIKVFLVTGRLQGGAEKFWRELMLDTPIASCNGARVGFPGQEPFLHIRLSEKVRNIVLDVEAENNLYLQYYVDDHIYTLHDSPEREWYSRMFNPVEKLEGRDDLLAMRLPTKIVAITPECDQPRVWKLFADALGNEAIITRSNERFTEIISPEADKGVGLRALSDWSGIPVENFIAVGDAMNDLPMLQAAGFAISFKSGDPKLAEHVDMLLPPLWEDGMEILAKCVLGMTNSGRFFTARTRRFFKK
jgi:Cof subfamily protein (haloacid dehalogenase superfamily)